MVDFNNIQLDNSFYEDLIKLLKINTIKDDPQENAPFGMGIKAGLEYVLDTSKIYGFNTRNLNNYIGYAEYGESDSDEYVGILGHIDVVPAEGLWDNPPFEPIIKEGKLYARGSLDDKGPLFAALYALKYLKDSNIKLSKKVRVIFGTNEESGTSDIDYYLEREKPPVMCFTPDAYFPIVTSEKGILTFELVQQLKKFENYSIEYIRAGKRSNIVPDVCECKFNFKDDSFIEYFNDCELKKKFKSECILEGNSIIIKSYGKAAHASTPEEGENAVCNMISYLKETLGFKDEFTEFLQGFVDVIGKDYYGKGLGINFEDEESGKLTINLGIVQTTSEEIKMRFNIRYPVTIPHELIIENIKKSVAKTTMEFIMGNHNEPLHFPKDHKLVQGLKIAYEETFKEEAKLLASGGGTYAKLMPNTVAFGPVFEHEPDLAHQVNEYIEISQLERAVKAYARAIYELAK